MRTCLLTLTLVGCDDTTTPISQADREVQAIQFFGGLCPWGACGSDLDFDADAVGYTWVVLDNDVAVTRNANARLTPAGQQARDAARDALEPPYVETYGCPGCDDGGALRMTLRVGDTVSQAAWEEGDPPPGAAAIEQLAIEVRDELTDCAGGPLTEGCTAVR